MSDRIASELAATGPDMSSHTQPALAAPPPPSAAEQQAGKYWSRRHLLWSKYDDGIRMDEVGWYSVSPEALALHTAAACVALCRGADVEAVVGVPSASLDPATHSVAPVPKLLVRNETDFRLDSFPTSSTSSSSPLPSDAPPRRLFVLDAFTGSGGNAIAFARQEEVEHVYALELDGDRLLDALHNAKIYGVAHKITFIRGNAVDVLRNLEAQAFIHVAPADVRELQDMPAPEGCVSMLTGINAMLDTSLDVIFLAPPWGGVGYKTASSSSTLAPPAKRGRQAKTAAADSGHRTMFSLSQQIQLHSQACAQQQATKVVAAAQQQPSSDLSERQQGEKRARSPCRCRGGQPLNGVNLVTLAESAIDTCCGSRAASRRGAGDSSASSASTRPLKTVAAFLPYNSDLTELQYCMHTDEYVVAFHGEQQAMAIPQAVPDASKSSGGGEGEAWAAGHADEAAPPPPAFKPVGLLAYTIFESLV